jgi:hypothetical protein
MEMGMLSTSAKRFTGLATAGMLAFTLAGVMGGHASAAENPPTCTTVPSDGQGQGSSTGGAPNTNESTQTIPAAPNGQMPDANVSNTSGSATFCTSGGPGDAYSVEIDPETCVVISITALPDGMIQGSAQAGPSQGNTQQGELQVIPPGQSNSQQDDGQGVPNQGNTQQGDTMTQNDSNQPAAQQQPNTGSAVQSATLDQGSGVFCAITENSDDQGVIEQVPASEAAGAAGAVCSVVIADGSVAPQVGQIVTGQVVACDASGIPAAPESGSSNSTTTQPGSNNAPSQPGVNTAPTQPTATSPQE